MKPIKFLHIMLVAAAGLVASCSAPRLANNQATDDVYNTTAKAQEVTYAVQQPQQQQNTDVYDDGYYGTSNPYLDMDYSSRINRFSNGYSWRSYYDPFYDNNYYGYGLGWNTGFGLNYGLGIYGGIWNNPFYGGFYNRPYYGYNYWGPYSYYDQFGWGGGYYGGGYGYGGRFGYGGGGYFGGGVYTNSANNRPRPSRGGENRDAYTSRGRTDNAVTGNYGRPALDASGRPSRVSGNNSSQQGNRTSQRPSRGDVGNSQTQQSRPQPQQSRPQPQQSQPTSRPERGGYTPAPSSSPSPSRSSGGGGGGSRPSRGGGR